MIITQVILDSGDHQKEDIPVTVMWSGTGTQNQVELHGGILYGSRLTIDIWELS